MTVPTPTARHARQQKAGKRTAPGHVSPTPPKHSGGSSNLGTPPSLAFELPPELEAHEPAEARGLARDEVRLLVSYRDSDSLVHGTFLDLPWFLDRGDLVVVNDSATLPAALTATLADGREIPLHLSTQLGADTWVVEPRRRTSPAAASDDGPPPPVMVADTELRLPAGGSARLLRPHHGSARLWVAQLHLPGAAHAYLRMWGRPIVYSYIERPFPLDAYQTVFAWNPGSAEMPSAGRPFSSRVLDGLAARGVAVETITLHTGVASTESHEPPYEEWFEVPERTAAAIAATKAAGGRVIAVGTTVLRALESALDHSGVVHGGQGWTDLVITPERPIRSADGLITGFHEPRATHLNMLAALAPVAHLQLAYEAALDHRYLWHEFGDVHLIL